MKCASSARLLRDPVARAVFFLYGGAAFHFFYAAYRLVTGILYRPYHVDITAFFYLTLAVNRLLLIRAYRNRESSAYVRAACRYSGRLLFLTIGIMLLAIVETVAVGRITPYPLYAVLISGGYAFASASLAVSELFVFRRLRNGLLRASRAVGLTAALLSVFAFLGDLLRYASFVSTETERALLLFAGSLVILFVLFFAVWLSSGEKQGQRMA